MSRADAGRAGRPRSAPAAGRQPGRSPTNGTSPGVDAAPPAGPPADTAPVDGALVDGAPGDAALGDAASGGAASGGVAEGGVAADVVARRSASWVGWDPVIRVAGVVISIAAAFLSGTFEVLLTTLRAGDFVTVWRGDAIGSGGGPLIPVSILLAVVLNYGIAWFAVSTTRRRWALAPPWALWTLMMFAASGVRTSEGDYLLGGENWVALVMILAGSLSFAVYSYRMILKRVKP